MKTFETRYAMHEPPAPWRLCTTWADGGLFQIGYAEDSDLLIALSSPQGRFLFNCLTGEIVASDYEEVQFFFDRLRLLAKGFGPLEGKNIRMAGRFGGGLPLTTEDGWELHEEAPEWPTHNILLTSPTVEREDDRLIRGETIVIGNNGDSVLRAYGFSETGHSFVIATSCDLTIFVR